MQHTIRQKIKKHNALVEILDKFSCMADWHNKTVVYFCTYSIHVEGNLCIKKSVVYGWIK